MKTIQKFNYYSQTFERKGLPYKGWDLWNYIYIYILDKMRVIYIYIYIMERFKA